MIRYFEKHSKISWLIAIFIAVVIFYISSISFEAGKAVTGGKSYIYHFFAFFFFAFFLLPALVKGRSKTLFFISIILAVLYAVSDEIHQLFVPERYCSFSDVLINSAGILSASLLYTLSLKRRRNSMECTPKSIQIVKLLFV